jgi:hypothetical protein
MMKKTIKIYFYGWFSFALVSGVASFFSIAISPFTFDSFLSRLEFISGMEIFISKFNGSIYSGLACNHIFELFTCITWLALILSVPLLCLHFFYVMSGSEKLDEENTKKFKRIVLSLSGSQWLSQMGLGIFMIGCMGYFFVRSIHWLGNIQIYSPGEFAFNLVISEVSLYLLCLLLACMYGFLLTRLKYSA